jgi:hypothetical protein
MNSHPSNFASHLSFFALVANQKYFVVLPSFGCSVYAIHQSLKCAILKLIHAAHDRELFGVRNER